MTQQTPWAVLLCKFKDDQSEPPLPHFREACENFFTTSTGGTEDNFDVVRYFSDMSHGNLDLSGSQVFGWYVIDVNVNDVVAPTDPPPPGWTQTVSQSKVVELAKSAASNSGINLGWFYGVVVIMNRMTGWAQGYGPDRWVAADYRRVNGDGQGPSVGHGNGTECFGQEMGHGYGLGHSRRDGSQEDYQDPWDVMSTDNAYSAPDDRYAARGPGLNAWNMRGRGWLDESRVWKPRGDNFDQTIELRPLHRRDLAGWLAAELPPRDQGEQGRYLVEFRVKQGWDQGFPRSAVFVHRYEDEQHSVDGSPHSYVMPGTQQSYDLVQGDVLDPALPVTSPRVDVLAIDESNLTATVRLRCHGLLTNVAPAASGRKAADGSGYLFVFATAQDGRILFNQAATGGAFVGWQEVPGGVTTDVPVGTGMQGDTLFVFAKTHEGRILFNQAAAEGAFVGWQEMPGE